MHRNQQKGFTLIELVIALAILAIIVAVAVPSYRAQALRGNRTQAVDELLRQAAFQQRQFTVNNQYSAVAAFNSSDNTYQIVTALQNGGLAFTLSAVPIGGQADDTCGTLLLTSLGARTSTVGDNDRCWGGRTG